MAGSKGRRHHPVSTRRVATKEAIAKRFPGRRVLARGDAWTALIAEDSTGAYLVLDLTGLLRTARGRELFAELGAPIEVLRFRTAAERDAYAARRGLRGTT